MPAAATQQPHMDGRSSYLQRVHTLAGPGAYAIPSTFRLPTRNEQLHKVHLALSGREFAR